MKFINFETKINRISQNCFCKKTYFMLFLKVKKVCKSAILNLYFFRSLQTHQNLRGRLFLLCKIKKAFFIFLEVCKWVNDAKKLQWILKKKWKKLTFKFRNVLLKHHLARCAFYFFIRIIESIIFPSFNQITLIAFISELSFWSCVLLKRDGSSVSYQCYFCKVLSVFGRN